MDFYTMPGLGIRPTPDTRDPSVMAWEAAYEGRLGDEAPLTHRGIPELGTD